MAEFPMCNLPPVIAERKEAFEAFYKGKFQEKKLSWLYQHGSVNLLTLFTHHKYLLKVNVAQATILLQYDELSTDVLSVG